MTDLDHLDLSSYGQLLSFFWNGFGAYDTQLGLDDSSHVVYDTQLWLDDSSHMI